MRSIILEALDGGLFLCLFERTKAAGFLLYHKTSLFYTYMELSKNLEYKNKWQKCKKITKMQIYYKNVKKLQKCKMAG